jgi:single-strand DNA-binding protein
MEETMNSLNSILIEGNLTKDPKLSETPKGTSVCNFSLASNRFYKQDGSPQNEVSFFDVEVWAKLAQTCSEYLSKGRGVRVVGRLKQDRWQDKEGKPASRVKIVAEHVEFRPEFKKKEEESEEESETLLTDSEPKEAEEVAESV